MSAWEWPRAEDGTRIVGPLPFRAVSANVKRRFTLPSIPVSRIAPSAVELAGLASVGYGLWLVYEPAAFIVCGLAALAPTVVRNVRRDAA